MAEATSTALWGSYKAKIFFVTALLLLVPVVLVFALAMVGKATVENVIQISEWAMGALGVSSTGTIVGRALEGMAERGGPKSVVAGGDVLVAPSVPPSHESSPGTETPAIEVPAIK